MVWSTIASVPLVRFNGRHATLRRDYRARSLHRIFGRVRVSFFGRPLPRLHPLFIHEPLFTSESRFTVRRRGSLLELIRGIARFADSSWIYEVFYFADFIYATYATCMHPEITRLQLYIQWFTVLFPAKWWNLVATISLSIFHPLRSNDFNDFLLSSALSLNVSCEFREFVWRLFLLQLQSGWKKFIIFWKLDCLVLNGLNNEIQLTTTEFIVYKYYIIFNIVF